MGRGQPAPTAKHFLAFYRCQIAFSGISKSSLPPDISEHDFFTMRKKNFFQHWEGLNPQPLSPNPQSLSSLNMFLAISLCVSVFNALTFESLNLESSYFVCSYIVRIFRSGSYIKASESRSRSQEQKGTSVSVRGWSTFV